MLGYRLSGRCIARLIGYFFLAGRSRAPRRPNLRTALDWTTAAMMGRYGTLRRILYPNLTSDITNVVIHLGIPFPTLSALAQLLGTAPPPFHGTVSRCSSSKRFLDRCESISFPIACLPSTRWHGNHFSWICGSPGHVQQPDPSFLRSHESSLATTAWPLECCAIQDTQFAFCAGRTGSHER
jgi:hypothetical protein